MKIRNANLEDYEELVFMYKELTKVVYEGFEIGEDIFFYGAVQKWFQNKKDIIICEKDDGTITGFSLAKIEDVGIVKPYYFGEIVFVKEEFRKGRSAYLLYNNGANYAKELGIPVLSKAFVGNNENKVDQIQAKFGEPFFIEYKQLNKKIKDGKNGK